MKRVEFTITGDDGRALHEPGFVENCADLPLTIMRAVEDFIEVQNGELHLPITIRVQPNTWSASC